MTYAQVLNSIRELVANGNFTYLEYLRLVFQNWFTATMYIFSIVTAMLFVKTIAGTTLLYVYEVVKGIKTEIEG